MVMKEYKPFERTLRRHNVQASFTQTATKEEPKRIYGVGVSVFLCFGLFDRRFHI